MTNYTAEVKSLIDDLKAICVSWGMSWSAHEYEIITQSFLYKFLNDKFLYEVTKRWYWETYDDLKKLSEDDYNKMLSFEIWNAAAHFKPEHLLSYLFNHQSDKDFSLLFDDTLNDIASNDFNRFVRLEAEGKLEKILFHIRLDEIDSKVNQEKLKSIACDDEFSLEIRHEALLKITDNIFVGKFENII